MALFRSFLSALASHVKRPRLVIPCLAACAAFAWPLSPTLAQCGQAQEVLKALSDQSSAFEVEFGDSIDIQGDTAVIGVPKSDLDGYDRRGLAYVYVRVGSEWQFQARLAAADVDSNKGFGTSVAVHGDRIAVGGSFGEVYTFTRSGTVWTQTAKITLSWSNFVEALDLSATHLVAGVPIGGRAYVYGSANGSTWTLEANLFPSVASEGSRFGCSVAIDGLDVAVGQGGSGDFNSDTDFRFNSCVRTYRRIGGVWTAEQELRAASTQQFNKFGESVSIVGNTLVVGSPGYRTLTPSITPNAGAVYAFTRTAPGATWSEFQLLVAVDPKQDVRFGSTVKLASATDLLIGAPGWVPGLVTQFTVGAAYAFRFAGGFWAQNEVIPNPNSPATSEAFGRCVAAALVPGGMRVLIGAPRESEIVSPFRRGLGGAVYAFDVPASGFAQTQKLLEPLGLNHQAGFAVAVSGDWAVVGVPYAEPPVVSLSQVISQSSARGEALVYRRVDGLWTFHSTLVGQTASTGSRFGQAVAIDGTTIVIGAPEYDYTDIDTFFYDQAGSVFVFTLNDSVWTEQQQILNPSAAAGDLFGYAVAVRGDLLLVGAPTDNTAAGTNAGSAYTFTRTAGVWGDPHVVTPPDAAANDLFGNSVGIIGNVGITFGRYIVVSAYLDDDLGADSGSATLFRETLISGGGGGGGGFFWDSIRKFVAADGQAGDHFGAALAVGGSVIVFGARLEDTAGTSAGAAYVFRNTMVVGNPNWGTGFKVVGSGVAANDRFGASVATDGSTVVVGAPLDDNAGGSNAGAAFIFRRVGSDWVEQQKIGAADRDAEDQFGHAVAVSGSTILVGAPLDDNAEGNDSGAAYFFDYALTVPTIATQPASGAACRGDKTFSVVAAGGGPYIYQWKRNTVNLANGPKIAGATTATLSLTGLRVVDEGSYTCLITSPCGSITSNAALLTVCPADFDCIGGVVVTDIFSFLSAWFAGNPAADYSDNGTVDVADIFSFLSAWFAGCP